MEHCNIYICHQCQEKCYGCKYNNFLDQPHYCPSCLKKILDSGRNPLYEYLDKKRQIHGLSHYGRDCQIITHARECKICLFAMHIDRGDWIIEKMCEQGAKLLREEIIEP